MATVAHYAIAKLTANRPHLLAYLDNSRNESLTHDKKYELAMMFSMQGVCGHIHDIFGTACISLVSQEHNDPPVNYAALRIRNIIEIQELDKGSDA